MPGRSVRGVFSRQLDKQVDLGVRSEVERGFLGPPVCRWSLKTTTRLTCPGSRDLRKPARERWVEKERGCESGLERLEDTWKSVELSKPKDQCQEGSMAAA